MRVKRSLSPARAAALVIVISLALLSAVQAKSGDAVSSIKIKNFGSINENYYRGAQPKGQDYKYLASAGIRTVIDLQRQGQSDEQRLVEAAGMKFYRIGMSDKSQPQPAQVEEFLKIVNDTANQPVFVHCRGGRHRTGAMTAIYRMTREGWTADLAFKEMKQYDFDHGFGHGALKDFVYEYYARMDQKSVVVNTSK
jgi:protein tyrosine/serine phosphatase